MRDADQRLSRLRWRRTFLLQDTEFAEDCRVCLEYEEQPGYVRFVLGAAQATRILRLSISS